MVTSQPSKKAEAWVIFDRIVALAAPNGTHTNPWISSQDGALHFEPDYSTLAKLLGVPLYLKAGTQSGVPALALDVWLSYELRRAGFNLDQVWPRPNHPRILPAPISSLLTSLPRELRGQLAERVFNKDSISGVTSSSASILGKNYFKQVDVIITDWDTGPELLISTKRMDSSYGKNAPNRIEESYGDAKNLRLRHPLAALGFVFGLRSDILDLEPRTAKWLFDLLTKLGREDDAYHATCLVLMEYSDDDAAIPNTEETRPAANEFESVDDAEDASVSASNSTVDREIEQLPLVTILTGKIPEELSPSRFLTAMVNRVLSTTPVDVHEEARQRRDSPEVR